MAHVYVYSPSGAVRDRAAFKRGVARLNTATGGFFMGAGGLLLATNR